MSGSDGPFLDNTVLPAKDLAKNILNGPAVSDGNGDPVKRQRKLE